MSGIGEVPWIDVPFGWPITFQRFLKGDPNPLAELGAAMGVLPVPGDPHWRRLLQFRRTDLLVRQHPDFGIWPMSVTSNQIADRDEGIGPAGKGPAGGASAPPGWLMLSNGHRETCRTNDNALDALLCALIAGARLAGAWITPDSAWAGPDGIAVQRLSEHDRKAIATEGWIVLPTVDLTRLHSTLVAHAQSATGRSR
jgi:hypothetical protein